MDDGDRALDGARDRHAGLAQRGQAIGRHGEARGLGVDDRVERAAERDIDRDAPAVALDRQRGREDERRHVDEGHALDARAAAVGRARWARARICPAGASSVSASPRVVISPRSIAIVTTAMMPWPHIVLKPSLCMKSTPASESARSGSVRSAPYMSAWPRGSNITARRSASCFARAHARRSSIVAPFGAGHPSVISLSGSPAV